MKPVDSSVAEPEDAGPSANQTGSAWRGKLLSACKYVGFGIAINQVSPPLGDRWLPGILVLVGVVWVADRGHRLDSRARFPRCAPWIFLVFAGCMAIGAIFSSGSTVGSLTSVAADLATGAALMAKGLNSAVRLLFASALIMAGSALIADYALLLDAKPFKVPPLSIFMFFAVCMLVILEVMMLPHTEYGEQLVESLTVAVGLFFPIISSVIVLFGCKYSEVL